MKKAVSAGLTVLSFFSVSVFASALEDIRALWFGQAYQQVIAELTSFRDSDFGKNVEVDYMFATSLCRYGTDHDLGRAFLINILRVYELSDENRDAIANELAYCPAQSDPEALAFLTSRSTGGGDAGVRGKMFYFLGGENRAIGGDPLEPVEEIPQEVLLSRLVERPNSDLAAQAMIERLARFTISHNVFVSERFAIGSISNHSDSDLVEIARLLEKALNYFVNNYNVRVPKHYFNVYLVPDGRQIRDLGKYLHGLSVKRGTIGYSFKDDLSVTSVVRGPYAGTLKHELTHLMVRTNFGDIPPWLDEGLAALFEVSRQEGPELRGLPNWRGQVLEKLWSPGNPDVHQVLGMNWKEFDVHGGSLELQAVHHALARYWILYLQDMGYLGSVYNAFRTRDIRNTTDDAISDADRLFEKATGQALASLESDFYDWLSLATRPPSREEISDLQRRLVELGYDVGGIDGIAGPQTRRAVKRFQLDGEFEADGIIDRALMDAVRAKTGK